MKSACPPPYLVSIYDGRRKGKLACKGILRTLFSMCPFSKDGNYTWAYLPQEAATLINQHEYGQLILQHFPNRLGICQGPRYSMDWFEFSHCFLLPETKATDASW